jgi:hypothetical protein
MNKGMHTLRTLGIGLALALTALGSARATPPVDEYGGYFGRVDYASGTGWIIGAYPTLAECDLALQDQIVGDMVHFGDTVASVLPCFSVSSADDAAILTAGAIFIVSSGDDDRDGGDKKRKKITH